MPFGPYQDFAECVAQNQGKENPEAFCAWLYYKITGAWPVSPKAISDNEPDDLIGSQDAFVYLIHHIHHVSGRGNLGVREELHHCPLFVEEGAEGDYFEVDDIKVGDRVFHVLVNLPKDVVPPDTLYDHLGNAYVIKRKGIDDKDWWIVVGLKPGQEVKWSDDDNLKGGVRVSRKETDAIEYTLRKIEEAVRDKYGRDWRLEPPVAGPDMGVVWTFEDAVIAKDYDTSTFFEIPYILANGEVTLGTPVPVESYYILKRLANENPEITMKDATKIFDGMMAATKSGAGVELTGPIVFKNEPERIAFAAVLVPGEPDLDFDKGEKILSEEEVERVANQWLADYANIDLLHSLNNVAVPVQSYTTYSERTVKVGDQDLILPKGTWILGSRLDEQTWKGVMNGTLTGYSVMGIRRTALKNLIGAMKTDKVDIDASLKKTLLKDLGPDWVAPFVSVVDTPAVPKSKWFALKGKSAMSVGAGAEGSKIPWFNRIMEVVSGVNNKDAEKAGRRYSDTTYQKMKLIFDTMKALMEEAEAERKERITFGKKAEEVEGLDEQKLRDLILETFKTAMPEALKDVTERLGKLESAEKKEAEKQDEKPPEEKGTDPELLASEILKRLEKLESAKTGGMSKALKGQDGDDGTGKQNEDTGRDLYGRKRKGGRE